MDGSYMDVGKPNNIPYKLKHIYGVEKVDKINEDDLILDEEKKLVFREKNLKMILKIKNLLKHIL